MCVVKSQKCYVFYSLRGQGTQYLTNIYLLPWLEVTKLNYVVVTPEVQLLFSIILNLFIISYIYLDTSRAAVIKLDINIQENNWSSRMQLFLCYRSPSKLSRYLYIHQERNTPNLKNKTNQNKRTWKKDFRLHAINRKDNTTAWPAFYKLSLTQVCWDIFWKSRAHVFALV